MDSGHIRELKLLIIGSLLDVGDKKEIAKTTSQSLTRATRKMVEPFPKMAKAKNIFWGQDDYLAAAFTK